MKVYAVPKYLFNAELAKIVARAIVLRLKGIQDKKRKAEEAWKEYIKIVTPHEDRFRRILKKLFKAQEQEVLRNMRRSSKSLVITKDKINTWLFDEKEWKEKFGQAEEDFLAGLATEVGNQTVESLPVVGMMFDVNNPNLRKRMDKRVGEFKGVVDTTTRKIRDSLTAGIDAGESIDELADRVINVFKDASYNRAEMIARTETIWGSNAATESTYMQSGVVEGKEWQVALDERLCFPAPTKVMTDKGFKPISKIKVGDRVLTHRDRYKRVSKVFSRSFNGMYVKIKTEAGGGFTTTALHPVLVNGEWKEARWIKPGDKILCLATKCRNCGKLIPHWRKICSYECNAVLRNKEIWSDPAQRQRVSNENKKYGKSRLMREAFNKKCKSSEFHSWWRSRISRANKKAYAYGTEIWKKKAEINKRLAQDPDWGWRNKKRLESALKKAFKSRGRIHSGGSSLEIKVRNWLDELGVEYVPQKYYNNGERRFWVDFYLPEYNIIIEVDGKYWHNESDVKERDEALKKVFTGKILHFKEDNIVNDFAMCADQFYDAVINQNCFCEVKVKSVRKWFTKRQPVYNLTVEEDETYTANGFVVHNCSFCMHMYEHYGPGKGGLGLGERFFEQGDSLQVGEGESRSELVFNYEPIEHPPLHPRCRCVLVGTLIDLDKLIGDLEDQIEGDFFTFKNKSDYLKYKKYMDEYYERVRLLPDDVVAPILRREMEPLIEMTRLLESWQGSASGKRAIQLRCLAKELENYSYDIWIREQGRDKVDRIMREVRQKLEEFRIPYLKMRAITQAYFKRMGKKTIVLSRGIDGRTGKIWRKKIREYLERGEKYINIEENNLAGWTSSDYIAEKFGIGEGGVIVSHNFDVRDILVHHDVWPKTMFLNEEETIVFSGVRKYKIDEIRLE